MSAEERKAKKTAQSFYDILGRESAFNADDFCDLMSTEARQETIDYARQASGIDKEWNCQNSVELLVLRAKRGGSLRQIPRARIVGVNIEENRATATVRFGKGPLTSFPLVKEDGEWKLGSSGLR